MIDQHGEEQMNWVLEGMHVTAKYLNEFSVSGLVVLSRVTHGGEITHHVELDNPIQVYGRTANVVIVKHKEILTVKD